MNTQTLKVIQSKQFKRSLLSTAIILCLLGDVQANPQGMQVVAGQASATALGGLLEIKNTPGAILNWQTFNIEANETTRFIQENAASAVFNRVTGSNASQILGALKSNGEVFLINPNGILFGAGAVVDTAGFLASTLAASDADLLAGRFNFNDQGQAGTIRNLGQLNAHSGGAIVLIAPSVENHGIIHTEGEILLAAGHQVTLVDLQHPSVGLNVYAQEGAEAVNLGEVIGNTASFFGSLVDNQGYVEATGVAFGKGGTIRFVGEQAVSLADSSELVASAEQGGFVDLQAGQGDALVGGSIDVRGSNGDGGQINITGQRVALLKGANLNAEGAKTGHGGLVQVGGGWQGKNTDLHNSAYTVMQEGAVISANAGEQGDGGEVVLWSDERTDFHGEIHAKGGSVSGKGGQVETSGKKILQATGDVNVGSIDGGGLYLLDPGDIEIVATAPMTPLVGPPFDAGGSGAPVTSYVDTATLAAALENGSGAEVEVTTAGTGDGNITVVDPLITVTPGSPASRLKLTADGGISINAAVDLSSLPGTRLELTANGTIAINNNITLNNAEIIANYNVDSGFLFDAQFSNTIGSPPPLFVLRPFVLNATRQPGNSAMGFMLGGSASSAFSQFDLNFSPFADANGRFGASVTPVNFATNGMGLPYAFGSIVTNVVDVEFVLPQDVSLLSGGPMGIDMLDINSNVSFANLSTMPSQLVDISFFDLLIRDNGKLILNPFTYTSFFSGGSFRTAPGAELVLNGNADPNAEENLMSGVFDAGAVLDVTFLGGQLNPLDLTFSPFAPGVNGLNVIAKGFDSRIQNDFLQNVTLSIGPAVDVVVDSGITLGPLNSGSSLIANIPDFEDVLFISNYDSMIPMNQDTFVGTVSLAGKVTSKSGVVALVANDFILGPGTLISDGPQAGVTLEGNVINNNLINNGIVRTNGGLLGLTGSWSNAPTGVNPFNQGTIVGFDDLDVNGGAINTGSNRFVVIDDALVNFRGVSLNGKIDVYSGSALVLGYSGQGTGTQTSLNGAQITLAGYDAVFVEGDNATGVATVNGVGEIRSANQGNVVVASNFIPEGTMNPLVIPRPNTLNLGSGVQLNSLGNAASIQPEGYQLTNLNGGEPTFTLGRLPAAAVAVFDYDDFLQQTTTPVEYGAPADYVIDGLPDGSFSLDCLGGACLGVNNNQTVNYSGNLGLGNGGSFFGNLNLNNVVFSGSGTITGNVVLTGTSTFSPGNSPGQILVNGNMTLGPDSVCRFEFLGNGQQPGIDYDFLKVSGTLTRGGRLELADISGGALLTPQNFRFIEAGAFVNQFTQLTKLSNGTAILGNPLDGMLMNGVRTMTVLANSGTQTNTTAGQTLTQTQQPTTMPPPQLGPRPAPPPTGQQPTSKDEEEAELLIAAGIQGETPTQQSQSMQIKPNRTGSIRPVANCQ